MARPPFMPGPPMGMPQMGQPAPPPMRPPMPPIMIDDDEPASKRAKTEDQLIPEAEFLAVHQNQAIFLSLSLSLFLPGICFGLKHEHKAVMKLLPSSFIKPV